MSKSGHRQWAKKLRAYTRKLVYKPELRVDVPVESINTKKKIIELCEELLGAGVWIVRGASGGKTSKRVKWVRLAKVTVVEVKGGYKSRIEDIWRLQRYWFWRQK